MEGGGGGGDVSISLLSNLCSVGQGQYAQQNLFGFPHLFSFTIKVKKLIILSVLDGR